MRHLLCLLAPCIILIACGGSSSAIGLADGSAPDARVEPPVGADAGPDGSVDANVFDAPTEGGDDAGTCGAAKSGASCAACCQAAHPSSGFELVFYGSCELCGATCIDTKICSPPSPKPTTSACLACLKPRLQPPSDSWDQCQQSPACKAFVDCIKTCPTN